MKHTLTFLSQLSQNNNRDWFNEHKADYEQSHQEIIGLADAVLEHLKKHDEIETPSGKKSLMRIYRDTRFSKDKTPYKKGWSGSFRRAGADRRGGYYFHVEPGNNLLAGGFWGPEPKDLKQIRDQIAQDDEPLREILNGKEFKKYFGEMTGDQVKTAPKGFPKDHPAIDLLKFKQFVLVHRFTDKDALSTDFASKIADGFVQMRSFHDHFSYILTHDLNGVSLLE